MTAVHGLIVQLETAIRGVEAGAKHKSACITLVGSMKGTGVRPLRMGDTKDGTPIYLLNVEQARRLLARAKEAEEAHA